ncbi:MAG: transketolase, partial [Actinophytocola sp.]|nr:transketolase [Actinophytocola sp.]
GGDGVVPVAVEVVTGEDAVTAADTLAVEGTPIRVLDCYSIKPIDEAALRSAAAETRGIVTVEDHWPEGGLGDAVLGALADDSRRPPVRKLTVRDMPVSGKPAELTHAAGIDADAIVTAARQLAAAAR